MAYFMRQVKAVDNKKALFCPRLRSKATTKAASEGLSMRREILVAQPRGRTTYARDFDPADSYPTSQPQKDEG